jgi:hypothetical protein
MTGQIGLLRPSLVIPSEGRNPDGVGMINTKKGKGARDSSADL